ncbi:unnamed protein product, partial [marine sediment metagenome]
MNKKVVFVLFFLFFIFLINFASASVRINEVLPNPENDWDNNGISETYGDEWIELYSDSDENLDSWKIGDKVKNYTFSEFIQQGNFLIIYGSSSSLQLNNRNEKIFLYDENGYLIDSISYSSSSKDVSINLCNDEIVKKDPTPSSPNSCDEEEESNEEVEESDVENEESDVEV